MFKALRKSAVMLLTAAAAVSAAVGAAIPASAATIYVQTISLAGTRSGIAAGSSVSDWENTVKCESASATVSSQHVNPDDVAVNVLLWRNTLQADGTTRQYEEFSEDIFWPGEYKAKIAIEVSADSDYSFQKLSVVRFDDASWTTGSSARPINTEHSRYVWIETEMTVEWSDYYAPTKTLFLRSSQAENGGYQMLNSTVIDYQMSGLTVNHIVATDEAFLYFGTSMFAGKSQLKTVDLHAAHYHSGDTMKGWFSGCSRLEKVRLSGLDTSHVTSMYCTFNGCAKLTSVTLDIDTSNVSTMTGVFSGCHELTALDLRSWDTHKVTAMDAMFADCRALTSLNADPQKFNTGNVTTMESMFAECANLQFADSFFLGTANGMTMDTSKVTNMRKMFYDCETASVLNLSSFDTSNVTSFAYMFAHCYNLTRVVLTHFDTRKVTDMCDMFVNCKKLPFISLASFDTSNVTDVTELFYNCEVLDAIYVGKGWTNRAFTSTTWAFYLTNPKCYHNDYASNYTRNYHEKGANGTGGEEYTNKDRLRPYSWYSTNNPEDHPEEVFMLTDSGVRFDEETGTLWLAGCVDSREVQLYRNDPKVKYVKAEPDAYLVGDCSQMFRYFQAEEIDLSDICKFYNNHEHITNASYMFANSKYLKKVNLGNLAFADCANYTRMFSNLSKLETVYAYKFTQNTDAVGADRMFLSCPKLKGGFGTQFSDSYTGVERARMDYSTVGDVVLGGYFTGNMVYDSNTRTVTLLNGCTKNEYQTMIADSDNGENICTVRAERGFVFPSMSTSFFKTAAPSLTSIILDGADATQIVNARAMFSGNSTVKHISLIGMNFRKCNDFKNMFNGCSSLETLSTAGTAWAGLKHADGTEVTADMSNMFYNCSKLKSADLSGFSGSASGITHMFDGCYELTSVDISRLKTDQVTSFQQVFSNCRSLTELNLVNFTTDAVTNTKWMFNNCSLLKTIKVSALWDLANVTESTGMFYNCTSLVGGYGFAFNSSYTDKTYARPDTDGSVRGYLTETPFLVDHTLYLSGNIAPSAQYQSSDVWYIVALPGSKLPANCNNLFSLSNYLREIDLSKADGTAVTDMTYMFASCTKLTKINVSGLNVKNCTCMKGMFSDCTKLTEINMNGFNAANVTDVSELFEGDTALEDIDFSEFTSNRLQDMSFMLYGCRSLKRINFAPLNTSTVTNMKGLFSGCKSLLNIDLSTFSTANVTNMNRMFENCTSLTSLRLPDLKTSKVTDMSSMFYGCTSLQWLDFSANNTAKVTNMTSMFNGCTNLKYLTIGSLNTAKVTSMAYMFSGCKALEYLEFTVSTAAVTNMNGMFKNCSALETILVDHEKWNTDAVTASANMFSGCTAIVGANGTTYDADHVDKEYAVVDTKSTLKGYLTDVRMIHTSIVRSANITLDGTLRLNFYVTPSFELRDWPGAYAVFTVEGADQIVYLCDVASDSLGRYIIPCKLNATQMHEQIVLKLYNGIGEQCALVKGAFVELPDNAFTYSIVENINILKTNSDTNIKNLANAILDYGIASHRICRPNDSEYTYTVSKTCRNVSADTVREYLPTTDKIYPEGVTSKVMYLAVESDTTLSVTYYIDGDASDYTFYVDDKKITNAKKVNGGVQLAVKGIAAQNLAQTHTFKIKRGNVTYTVEASALAYGAITVGGTTDAANFAKALYRYYKMTDTFIKAQS